MLVQKTNKHSTQHHEHVTLKQNTKDHFNVEPELLIVTAKPKGSGAFFRLSKEQY